MPAEKKVSMLREVMDLPLGTQEKNILISGLSSVKSLSALELASSFLDEPEVASRAARAMLHIALPEPGVSGLKQSRDHDERVQIYRDMVRTMMELAIHIPMYHKNVIMAKRDYVKEFEAIPRWEWVLVGPSVNVYIEGKQS